MPACFYVPPDQWATGRLGTEESHHLSKVLRLRSGASIELFDGEGRRALAELRQADPRSSQFEVIREDHVPRDKPRLRLYQAIPKGKKMDLIIQKAVELGVSEIIPLYTKNTVAVPSDLAKKGDKWQRLALEACKQCKQSWLPQVHPPRSFASEEFSHDGLSLVASLRPGALPLMEVLDQGPLSPSVGLLIGPEGDLSAAELDRVEALGFQPISLGSLVLRVETATLCALSVLRITSSARHH